MDHRLALKQATLATLVAAFLFVPIVGLVLHDRALDIHAARVAVLLAAVFLWRYGLALLLPSRLRVELAQRAARVAAPFAGPLTALLTVRLAPLAGWLGGGGKPGVAALLAALVALPFLPGTTNYLIHVLSLTLIYVILGMGLNIVVGLAGLLDLGYVAFYAVGAYSYALLAQQLGLGFWSALPLVALLAGATGCALAFPVLRMHGDYLAIVTLGFGEIIRILLVNMTGLTGGPNGISAPRPTLFGLSFAAQGEAGGPTFHGALGIAYDARHRYVYMYLLVLAIAAAAVWVFHRLRQMPMGRAWEALREDEIACKALGIDPTLTKLSAFTLGATFGGVGGICFAAMEGFINPSSFTFIESAIILSIVVLGGMGSIVGVLLAAVAITLLPELFRQFEAYRMLVFGLAMVFVMVWRPGGLLQVRRRSHVSDAGGNDGG